MIASILLLSSIAFSAFFLASFLVVDDWAREASAMALALTVAQDESAARLSAFIADNSLVEIGAADLEYIGGGYDVTETPDEGCFFDALAMLAGLMCEESDESPVSTPVSAPVARPWDEQDTALARDWAGYCRFMALQADFPRIIRPEAAYVAGAEDAAFKADNEPVDDWFPRWCGALT